MRKGKKIYLQAAFLLFLIIGTVVIIRQQRDVPYQTNRGFIFGTIYHATYQYDKDLNQEIVAALNRVDEEFSMFNKKSTVTRFNEGKKIVASPMFVNLLQLSQTIYQATNGAFDITVAPLVNAWGFGFKHQQLPNQQLPNQQQVDSLRKFMGMHYISVNHVDGKTIVSTKHPHLMLDFSAIAKGYGSDVVADLMKRHGIKNYMIEIGGEIVASGLNEKRLPWKIGVTKPNDNKTEENEELQTVLNITNKAMATSGNYRNFYYRGKKKFAHTIDPRTGYPVQHSLLSATVIANSCAEADAYATAFMVMGVERAKEVLKQHQELMAYFIYVGPDGKNQVWFSPSLENKIVK